MAGSPKTADEVWAAVKAEVEALHVPFDGGFTRRLITAQTPQQVENLLRITAVTAYRLAQDDCADRIEQAAIHG